MSLRGMRDIHLGGWSGCYQDVSKALDVIWVIMSWSSCTGSVGGGELPGHPGVVGRLLQTAGPGRHAYAGSRLGLRPRSP